MCATAGLDVDSLNVDHSDLIARHNTTLIEVESML